MPTVRFEDRDADGFVDAAAGLSSVEMTAIQQLVASEEDPIKLFFRTRAGRGYEVTGLFDLRGRPRLPGDPGDIPKVPDGGASSKEAAGPIRTTRLSAAFPNPTSTLTSFTLELANSEEIRLEVFDLRGARVRTLAEGRTPAGRLTLTWDGRDAHGRRLADGLYLIRVRAGGLRETRSVLLMR
jgi:hypothetical protein